MSENFTGVKTLPELINILERVGMEVAERLREYAGVESSDCVFEGLGYVARAKRVSDRNFVNFCGIARELEESVRATNFPSF